MKCRHCNKEGVSAFSTQCPACGQPLGAFTTFGHYLKQGAEFLQSLWYRLWGGKYNVGKVRCPFCKRHSAFTGDLCEFCGFKFQVKAVFLWYLLPLLAILIPIYRVVRRSTRLQRFLFLFLYLGISTVLFLACLDRAQALFGPDWSAWLVPVVTAVFFTALLTFAASYIVPMHKLRLLLYIRPLVKIGIVLNFLTFMLFTLSWVSAHQQKAWTLIGIFFIALLVFWFFANIVYPLWDSFAATFQSAFGGASSTEQKAAGGYRGRRAQHRENRW